MKYSMPHNMMGVNRLTDFTINIPSILWKSILPQKGLVSATTQLGGLPRPQAGISFNLTIKY